MPGLWYKAVTLINAIRNVRYKVKRICSLKRREAYKIVVQPDCELRLLTFEAIYTHDSIDLTTSTEKTVSRNSHSINENFPVFYGTETLVSKLIKAWHWSPP
jgi:hypothetical protein